jgi:hypothetical protein
MREISLLAEDLFNFQEGLYSLQLLSFNIPETLVLKKENCFISRRRIIQGRCWTNEVKIWNIAGLTITRKKPKHYKKNLYNCLFVYYKSYKESPRVESETPRSEAGNLVLMYILKSAAVALQEMLNIH